MTTQALPLLTITLYCREWEQEADRRCVKIEANGSAYQMDTDTRALPIPELGGGVRANRSCFHFLYVLATCFSGRTQATVTEVAQKYGVLDGEHDENQKAFKSFFMNWGKRLTNSRIQFEAKTTGSVAWPGITFIIKKVDVETPDASSGFVSSNFPPEETVSTNARHTPTARAIAGLYGSDQQRVLEALTKLQAASPTEQESYKARLNQLADSRRKAAQDGSMLNVLREYYTPIKGGFSFYDLRVNSKTVRTLIATRAAWIPDTPAALDDVQCEFIDGAPLLSIPLPNINRTASILHEVELLNMRLFSKPLYRLLSVGWEGSSGSAITLQFSKDWYVRYHLTWGQLPEEGYKALSRTSSAEILARPDIHLPLREVLLPRDSDPANLSGRLSIGGISAVFAVAREVKGKPADFGILVRQRSAAVIDAQHLLSVVPTGCHQHQIEPEEEVSLRTTLLRELYEEAFGGEEVDGVPARATPDFYLTDPQHSPAMHWFHQHRGDAQKYQILLTCFGYSMRTGKYEFGALVVVLDPSFWATFSHRMQWNWEFDRSERPLVSTMDTGRIEDLMVNGTWEDECLMTFAQGLKALEEIAPDRVRLPPFAWTLAG